MRLINDYYGIIKWVNSIIICHFSQGFVAQSVIVYELILIVNHFIQLFIEARFLNSAKRVKV